MTDPSPDTAADPIAAEILRQTSARGPGTSICPCEVARALAGGREEDPWRPLIGRVRAAAIRLARQGRVEILRKGKPVSPTAEIRGVIRLRARTAGPEEAKVPAAGSADLEE